jgi:CDP-glycerol glycerophosphotransferase
MVALPRLGRRRKGDPRPRPAPQVSVVVPVYKVEQYLDECLTSVLGQEVPLEVIVVDDGSPDRSGAMADRRAAADGRVRVVHQANAGLGPARNVGAGLATAPYLTFCDGDDVVPPGAYARMLSTITSTGSDVVVGALERFDGDKRSMGPLMRRNHESSRLRVRVSDEPLLLADVFSVNKLFARQFWAGHGLAFPAGVRYEDQPTITRALLAAHRVDVLAEVVYCWRVRSDGSSITQGRAELADLRDRVVTKRDSTALVQDSPEDVLRTWYGEILPVDMWEYFRSVPGCSEEYWQLLGDAVREFWHEGTVPFPETLVPVQQRLMGWFVAQGRRADLERLIGFLDTEGVRIEERDGTRVFAHPWQDEPDLPRGCLRV